MMIQWLGHSCFKITDLGETVVFDPFGPGTVNGYRDIHEEANIVLCSHMHADHCCASAVKLVEAKHEIFKVETIETYHDDKKGALRGDNLIHIICSQGFKFAHMGDLGCDLDEQQVEKLKDLDVLMIPTGGYYTINGKKAAEIVKKLNPKVTIPMHYKDGNRDYDVLENVFAFTKYFDNVLYLTTDTLEFSDELQGEIVVFDYPEESVIH